MTWSETAYFYFRKKIIFIWLLSCSKRYSMIMCNILTKVTFSVLVKTLSDMLTTQHIITMKKSWKYNRDAFVLKNFFLGMHFPVTSSVPREVLHLLYLHNTISIIFLWEFIRLQNTRVAYYATFLVTQTTKPKLEDVTCSRIFPRFETSLIP